MGFGKSGLMVNLLFVRDFFILQPGDYFAGNPVGLAAKECNDLAIAVANGCVIDAGTASPRSFFALGFEDFTDFSRGEKVDVAGLGDGVLIVAVAGVGER